jgi:hypothetical protein
LKKIFMYSIVHDAECANGYKYLKAYYRIWYILTTQCGTKNN